MVDIVSRWCNLSQKPTLFSPTTFQSKSWLSHCYLFSASFYCVFSLFGFMIFPQLSYLYIGTCTSRYVSVSSAQKRLLSKFHPSVHELCIDHNVASFFTHVHIYHFLHESSSRRSHCLRFTASCTNFCDLLMMDITSVLMTNLYATYIVIYTCWNFAHTSIMTVHVQRTKVRQFGK